MRLSLLAVPAVVALAASLGCHNTQRVKYDVTGNAVAVDEPTYVAPANNAPAPTVMPDPTPAPTVTPTPAPTVTVAPAPVAPADPVVVEPKEHKEHKHHKGEGDKADAKGNTYVVVKGDTLQKISEKTYGTTKKWHLIMKANKLPDDKIHVGQKLVLPEVEKDAK